MQYCKISIHLSSLLITDSKFYSSCQRLFLLPALHQVLEKHAAEKFASHGYDCILNGRREDRLLELKTSLEKKYNIAVLLLPFDVQDEEKCFQSIQNIPAEWQKIDVLINNAGLPWAGIILMKQAWTTGIR